jgi:hypothetical protein
MAVNYYSDSEMKSIREAHHKNLKTREIKGNNIKKAN